MLAVGGSSMFLISVLVAGFGWAYKAAFLLLAVPLVSVLAASGRRSTASSAVTVLLLSGVSAVVVWNTVLATLAGLVVAGFAFGLGGTLLLTSVMPKPGAQPLPSEEGLVTP